MVISRVIPRVIPRAKSRASSSSPYRKNRTGAHQTRRWFQGWSQGRSQGRTRVRKWLMTLFDRTHNFRNGAQRRDARRRMEQRRRKDQRRRRRRRRRRRPHDAEGRGFEQLVDVVLQVLDLAEQLNAGRSLATKQWNGMKINRVTESFLSSLPDFCRTVLAWCYKKNLRVGFTGFIRFGTVCDGWNRVSWGWVRFLVRLYWVVLFLWNLYWVLMGFCRVVLGCTGFL